jgi:hypothetical protein
MKKTYMLALPVPSARNPATFLSRPEELAARERGGFGAEPQGTKARAARAKRAASAATGMRQHFWRAALGALVASALAGCGGNVIVESSGGGGSGGGPSTGGSTPTTSTSSSTTTPPATYCASVCAVADQYGCLEGSSVAECVAACVDLFNQYPGCATQITDLYDCALEEVGTNCTPLSTCDAEAQAFSECTSGTSPCGSGSCLSNEVSCSCQGQCDGVSYSVDCKQADNGIFCSCVSNGQEVGTCYDGSLSCDIFDSCCSGFFFGQEG